MTCENCKKIEEQFDAYMNKFQFTIIVNRGNTGHNEIWLTMEPSRKVMEVAEALSRQFKGSRVTVNGHARIRRTYQDGEIVNSSPDIHAFYKGMTSQDQWAWTCYGQVTD